MTSFFVTYGIISTMWITKKEAKEMKKIKNGSIQVLEFLTDVVIVVGVVLLLQLHVFSLGQVFGRSMESTLIENQRVLVDKMSYRFTSPNRFDIVTVKFPTEKEYWVKRVIGLPGEKIEYHNNQLYVNGVYVEEDFLDSRVVTTDFSTMKFFAETDGVIPEGNYLVLGDNRNVSKDSRIVGTIQKKDILGIVRFSLFPLDRIGFLNKMKTDIIPE